MKERFVYSIKMKTKTQSIASFSPAGNVCAGQVTFIYALPMSIKNHKRTRTTDLRLQLNFSISKLKNTASVNNRNQLHFKLSCGHITSNVKIVSLWSGQSHSKEQPDMAK